MKKMILVIGLVALVMGNMKAIDLLKYVKMFVPASFVEIFNREKRNDVSQLMETYCTTVKLGALVNDPEAIKALGELKKALLQHKVLVGVSVFGIGASLYGAYAAYKKISDKTKKILGYVGAGVGTIGSAAMLVHSGYNANLLHTALK